MSQATPPAWAAGLAARLAVEEPFASDGDFWRSVGGCADAAATLPVAVAVAVLMAVTGMAAPTAWVLAVPFVVPAALLLRAGALGRRSARSSRQAMQALGQGGRKHWRDAERAAVARVFAGVLLRPRLVRRTGT